MRRQGPLFGPAVSADQQPADQYARRGNNRGTSSWLFVHGIEIMNSTDAGKGPVKLRSLTSRGVLVPLRFMLGTSAAVVRSVPLLLVDLVTDDGMTVAAWG
jgi:hypothetical protein